LRKIHTILSNGYFGIFVNGSVIAKLRKKDFETVVYDLKVGVAASFYFNDKLFTPH